MSHNDARPTTTVPFRLRTSGDPVVRPLLPRPLVLAALLVGAVGARVAQPSRSDAGGALAAAVEAWTLPGRGGSPVTDSPETEVSPSSDPDTVPSVQVTFTKQASLRRYSMAVVRERGPQLAPRDGPGYHDSLPHDAVHFIVEAEAGLSGGAFGRVAAGQSNIFWAADPSERRGYARREKRRKVSPRDHDDMELSELLAAIAPPLWEHKIGRRTTLPDWMDADGQAPVSDAVLNRIVDRISEFAARWESLADGESITLEWPR